MTAQNLAIPTDRIAEFCRKWRITELSLFGSALREDFGPESDVDVLVVFADDASWDYFDWPDIQEELGRLFEGRRVDLVERKTVRNPFIRHEVLTSRKVLYAA